MRFALSQNGGMAEWLKAAVLKTASPKGDVGSNPTPSARKILCEFLPLTADD